ncbi:MAG: hypothetical protein H6630_00180 [Arcobacter sp.]|nr:hypothetical protein [Arcobacter sp.]
MIDLIRGEASFEYDRVKRIYENKGKNYFFKLFDRIFRKEIYSMSEYWLDNRIFILKLKGKYGDVIVCWK